MATLTLTPNHPPLRLTLKQKSPIEKPDRTGMRYLYLLTGGDGIYLPPLAHAEIQSLRPEPGEAFLLGSKVGQGNALEYFTERCQPNAEPAPERKPPLSARGAVSIPIDPTISIPPDLTTPESVRLFTQLVATIRAVKAAEVFAESIGRPVRFESADIRAMANSAFINEQQGRNYGRRVA